MSSSLESLRDDCLQHVTTFLPDASLVSVMCASKALRRAALREPVYSARCRLRAPAAWSRRGGALDLLRAQVGGSWRAVFAFFKRCAPLGYFRLLSPHSAEGCLALLAAAGSGLALRALPPVAAERAAWEEELAGSTERAVDVLLGADGLPSALRLRATEELPALDLVVASAGGGQQLLLLCAPPWDPEYPLAQQLRLCNPAYAARQRANPLRVAHPFLLEALPSARPARALLGRLGADPHWAAFVPPLASHATGLFQAEYGGHGAEVVHFSLQPLSAAAGGEPPENAAPRAALDYWARYLAGYRQREAPASTLLVGSDPARSLFAPLAAADFVAEHLPPTGCSLPPFVLLGRKVTGDRNVPSGQASIIAFPDALVPPPAPPPATALPEPLLPPPEPAPSVTLMVLVQCNRNQNAWHPYQVAARGVARPGRIEVSAEGFEMVFTPLGGGGACTLPAEHPTWEL